jgi:hypothetical protein
MQNKKGELLNIEQKQKVFNSFLKPKYRVSDNFFKTVKGFKLGDSKDKLINYYGKPDSTKQIEGVEELYWNFIGDISHNEKNYYNRRFAKNSFGHKAILFFKNTQLIGIFLFNEIP